MHEASKLTELQSYNVQEGQRVKAMYIATYPIEGEVTYKRTKYGWKVQYGIKIEQDLSFPFKSDVYRAGTVIGVDNTNLIEVL